jgi:hypothetical protein
MRRFHLLSAPLLLVVLAACGQPEVDPNIADPLGRCVYVNSFSDASECREFYGSDWTPDAMKDQCDSPVPGSDPGLFEPDVGCDYEAILGECVIDEGTVESSIIVFPGDDPADCSGLNVGCSFAGGEFVPSAVCGGQESLPPVDYVPFQPLQQVCVPPLPGEPEGMGPDGDVCTWEAINASTEEGRHFADYASCDVVYTQRPYWASEVEANTPDDDPRYDDQEWQTEFDWITTQVEASACVCCHSAELAPNGPSGWFLEADGLWVDTLDDDGMAMLAGWIDSTAFGAFDPADNNHFERELTGLPSTDPPRTLAFFEAELARRGLVESDFADAEPFGGPLADQLVYEPGRCEGDVGVDDDGTVRWSGGPARYLYVLAAGSDNPGVPPNLDLPEGTLWRVDVPPTGDAIASGLSYGDPPGASVQAFPTSGAPQALVPGQDYYLYVLFDIVQPITRCVFTAE